MRPRPCLSAAACYHAAMIKTGQVTEKTPTVILGVDWGAGESQSRQYIVVVGDSIGRSDACHAGEQVKVAALHATEKSLADKIADL